MFCLGHSATLHSHTEPPPYFIRLGLCRAKPLSGQSKPLDAAQTASIQPLSYTRLRLKEHPISTGLIIRQCGILYAGTFSGHHGILGIDETPATGFQSTATGLESTMIGFQSTATGLQSTAVGTRSLRPAGRHGVSFRTTSPNWQVTLSRRKSFWTR
ncbi:MAG: hypothetical protein LBF74_12060 [Treponema sp.]|nr:hypothetical protein [Treponema sp.]